MEGVFPLAPAAGRAAGFVGGLTVLFVILAGLMLAIGWSTRHAQIRLEPGALVVRGDLYGRRIPLDRLDVAAAHRVDFVAEPGLRPKRRTNGIGTPGYSSGWFRLRNGSKALLFLTDRSRAVAVPTRDGYTLLVSPRDPDAFLAALRRTAGVES